MKKIKKPEAVTKMIKTHIFINKNRNNLDVLSYLFSYTNRIILFIRKVMFSFRHIKMRLILNIRFKKRNIEDDTYTYCEPYFSTDFRTLLFIASLRNIHTILENMYSKLICNFETFTSLGSGWQIDKIKSLEITTIKYDTGW